MAVNPSTNTVYGANYSDNSVTVINGSTNKLTSSIPVGNYPYAVAVNPSTNTVYVANRGGNSVSVINGLTNIVTSTVSVGNSPDAVAVNPSTNAVYVANAGGNSVSVIDGSSDIVTYTIPVGSSPEGVAVNPSTNTVYVTNQTDNTVSVVDGSTNTVTSTISVGQAPFGVAVNPSTNAIYVTNQTDNTVSVVDGSTNTVTATVSVGSHPEGLAVNPSTNAIYVANYYGKSVSVINGATLPEAPSIVSSSAGNGAASLAWTVPSAGDAPISSYAITANPPSGPAITTSVPASQLSATLTGLTNGTTYSVTVTAVSILGAGSPSSSVNLTPIAVLPSAPTEVSATRGNAQATVAWTDGASNGSAITAETIYVYSGSTVVATKSDCSSSPCVVTGLTNGTSYSFKVSDTNGIGEGALSEPSNAVTPAGTPGSPQSISITASGGQAIVSWSPPSSDGGSPITLYSVATTTGSHTCSYTVTSPETDTCTITGLTNGTIYTFVVTPTNDVGPGTPSTGTAATVLFPAPVLTSAVAAQGKVTLAWTAPTVTDKKIKSFTATVTDGHGHNFYCNPGATTKKCVITGLTDLTTYSASVVATENNGGTITASSNALSATPAQPLTLPYIQTTSITRAHTATINWGPSGGGDGQPVTYSVVVKNSGGTVIASTSTSSYSFFVTGLTKGSKYSFTITASTAASTAGWIPSVTTKVKTFTAL